MINFIKCTFGGKGVSSDSGRNDFSDFFVDTNRKTRAKVIRQVLRDANNEQKALIKKRTSQS